MRKRISPAFHKYRVCVTFQERGSVNENGRHDQQKKNLSILFSQFINGPSRLAETLMHGVQKDVKMLETHSISNYKIDLVQDGFNGIERDHAPFHPDRIIFGEPL